MRALRGRSPPAFRGLRGFFSLCVCVAHALFLCEFWCVGRAALTALEASRLALAVVGLGFQAVDLFFLFTAYTLARDMLHTLDAAARPPGAATAAQPGATVALLFGVARLYGKYLLLVALAVATTVLLGGDFAWSDAFARSSATPFGILSTALSLLRPAILLQINDSATLLGQPSAFVVLWSAALSIKAAVFVLLPLIVLLHRCKRARGIVFVACAIAALAVRAIIYFHNPERHNLLAAFFSPREGPLLPRSAQLWVTAHYSSRGLPVRDVDEDTINGSADAMYLGLLGRFSTFFLGAAIAAVLREPQRTRTYLWQFLTHPITQSAAIVLVLSPVLAALGGTTLHDAVRGIPEAQLPLVNVTQFFSFAAAWTVLLLSMLDEDAPLALSTQLLSALFTHPAFLWLGSISAYVYAIHFRVLLEVVMRVFRPDVFVYLVAHWVLPGSPYFAQLRAELAHDPSPAVLVERHHDDATFLWMYAVATSLCGISVTLLSASILHRVLRPVERQLDKWFGVGRASDGDVYKTSA